MEVTDKVSALEMIDNLMNEFNIKNKEVVQRKTLSFNNSKNKISTKILEIDMKWAIKILLKYAWDNSDRSSYDQSISLVSYINNSKNIDQDGISRYPFFEQGYIVCTQDYKDYRYLNPNIFRSPIWHFVNENNKCGLVYRDRGIIFIPQDNSNSIQLIKVARPEWGWTRLMTNGSTEPALPSRNKSSDIQYASNAFFPMMAIEEYS